MKRDQPGLLLTILSLTLAGCGGQKAPSGPPAAHDQAQPGLFTLAPDQLAHLQVVPVRRTDWSITVRTTGTVDWDADHTSPAITQVSGPIARIVVDLGSAVPLGGPLLYVGRDMKTSHKGMGISESDWRTFIGHLEATLDSFKVPTSERAAVLAFVDSTKRDIVE